MTVNSTVIKDQYDCNGVLTAFAFTFKVWDSSEVKVTLRDSSGVETVLTETVHYTVTLSGDAPSAGSVSTVATYAAGYTLTLKETLPLTQLVDWGEGDRFSSTSHEEAADRAAIKDQQMEEKFSRALLLPESTAHSDLEFPEPSALKVPMWNAAGDGLENAELVALGSLTGHITDATSPHAAYEALCGFGRNLIINGGSHVVQRQALDMTTKATTVYGFGKVDRFEASWEGTACTNGSFSRIADAELDSYYGMQLINMTITGDGYVRIRYRMGMEDSIFLNVGKTSIGFKVKHDLGAACAFQLKIYKANVADTFAATTLVYTGALESIPDATMTAIAYDGITDLAGNGLTGLEFVFEFHPGAITTKDFTLGDVQVERNNVATRFEHRHIGHELKLCERYYQHSYEYTQAAGAATVNGQEIWACSLLANTQSVIYAACRLPVHMRTTPTVTLYDSAGTAGKVNCIAAGVDGTVSQQKPNIFWVNATMSGANTQKQLSYHWVADAEF